MTSKTSDSARSDAHPHDLTPSAAFLAADADAQSAKLADLLASVPLDLRPVVLQAYTLGQSAAALPWFAHGIEQGRLLERAAGNPDADYLTGYQDGLQDRPALVDGIRDMQAEAGSAVDQ